MSKYRILEFEKFVEKPFEIQERGWFGWDSVYCTETLDHAKALIEKWKNANPTKAKLIKIHKVE